MRKPFALTALWLLLLLAGCTDPDPLNGPGTETVAVLTDSVPLDPPRYGIRKSTIYGITPGMPLSEAADRLERGTRETTAGAATVYYIRGRRGERLGYLEVAEDDSSRVGDIHVSNAAAATEGGIRVGHTFDRLLLAYPKLEVRGAEAGGMTYAYSTNKAFGLRDFSAGGARIDTAAVPPTTRISEIVIVDRPAHLRTPKG
ncbi:hypothetical protein GGR26_001766 [Lewinella marina]|uniref:Uncharacterized protein n=1 Tax=Neolewinella marina TaxID=438751 RepID=A0A2G0CDI4_9BACT|nr:hypothetical protein [Neolewinella marina]NJB85998.1 hypothetical protein [Neolewinella marina]PHK98034.1 hypothetical protein CGL56_12650 [Neolewinella marina]